jgi:hypothetical protein
MRFTQQRAWQDRPNVHCSEKGDLATELSDDLRRLKQQIETGAVVRSEGSPDGHVLADHVTQRAAQPFEEAVR